MGWRMPDDHQGPRDPDRSGGADGRYRQLDGSPGPDAEVHDAQVADAPPTLMVPFPALKRFLVRAVVYTLLLGVPAAALAFLASNRAEPVFSAEATLLAPLRTISVDLPYDAPAASGPIVPLAYGAAIESATVLVDAWRRLNPSVSHEPSIVDIELLRDSVDFRFEERRRSTLIMIGAVGGSPDLAMSRANAVAAALLGWDDARARAEAAEQVVQTESRLAALERQLAELRSVGSRATSAQVNSLSLLTVELRQSLGATRSLAVGARGNLELLQPATRPMQIRPSPLVNALVAAGLSGILVVAVLLINAGRDRRVHTPAGLAAVSGLPLLAAFSELPDRARQKRSRTSRARSDTALPYLKAQIDRALRHGGNLLVVGMTESDSSEAVATALADLYEVPGSRTFVTTSPPLVSSGAAVGKAATADATILVADPRQTDRVQLSAAVDWLRRANASVLGIVASPGGGRPKGRGRPRGRSLGPGSAAPLPTRGSLQ